LFCAGQTGKVCWKDNWVAFLDSMLQMKIFEKDSRDLSLPTSLQKLTIDPKRHATEVQELNVGELVQLSVHDIVETMIAE
jgi:fatty acid synthase